MQGIHHRLVIETTAANLFEALTDPARLAAWWAPVSGGGELGGVLIFMFGPNGEHKVGMRVDVLQQSARVQWTCVEGPWVDVGHFEFLIQADERGVVLEFHHDGWPEVDGNYMHCNAKWGFFLVSSLKPYLEGGAGLPHPQDPDI